MVERQTAFRSPAPPLRHLPRLLVVLRVFRDVTEVAVQLWRLLHSESRANRLLSFLLPPERGVAFDDVVPHFERQVDLEC